MPRPVLVHYHMFKNAGTSLDWLLERSFGEAWTTFDRDGAESAEVLRAFLLERPHLRAVSSHLARPPLPWDGCAPLVMLRHPIDRARSVYQFLRRDVTQYEHHQARGTFAEFVETKLARRASAMTISDSQVFHLSRASFRGAAFDGCTDADLAEVQGLLRDWPAFGLVRDFAGSCAVFAHAYGRLFPQLRLAEIRENVSPCAARSEAEALAMARDELGETLYLRLHDANRLDLALYDGVQHAFDRAVADLRPGAWLTRALSRTRERV